jgi:hypothetical protein
MRGTKAKMIRREMAARWPGGWREPYYIRSRGGHVYRRVNEMRAAKNQVKASL